VPLAALGRVRAELPRLDELEHEPVARPPLLSSLHRRGVPVALVGVPEMSADSIEAARLLSVLPAEVRDPIVSALRALAEVLRGRASQGFASLSGSSPTGPSPEAPPPTPSVTHTWSNHRSVERGSLSSRSNPARPRARSSPLRSASFDANSRAPREARGIVTPLENHLTTFVSSATHP